MCYYFWYPSHVSYSVVEQMFVGTNNVNGPERENRVKKNTTNFSLCMWDVKTPVSVNVALLFTGS